MNKVLFNIRNAILVYKFWSGYKKDKIEYPEIQAHLEKKYGAPEFIDHFEYLDHWKVTGINDWGSSRPGNQPVPDQTWDERYREVDIFEKFMERKSQKKYSMTFHGGIKGSREMMILSYPMFITDEEKLTFTCELQRQMVNIFVNGIHMFTAQEPDFDGEYYVVFDDAPTTHKGKVKAEDIIGFLPRKFEIFDFRVYRMRE